MFQRKSLRTKSSMQSGTTRCLVSMSGIEIMMFCSSTIFNSSPGRSALKRCSSIPSTRYTIPTNKSSFRPIARPAKYQLSKSGCIPVSSGARSEEHTSELQSRGHLVCRLLLEKKKFQLDHTNQRHEKKMASDQEKI